MLTDFTLPTHFDANMDYSLIQKVKAHLDEIALQEQAFHLIGFFKEYPTLESFSLSTEYESDDEGGQYMYLSVYSCDYAEDDSLDFDLRSAISETLNEIKNEEFSHFYYYLTQESSITREDVEKQVGNAMNQCQEGSYDKWLISQEKAKLEASVENTQSKGAGLKI